MTAALVVSLLLHVLVVWRLPSLRLPASEFAEKRSGPLIVQIVPPPGQLRPPSPPAQPRMPSRPAPAQKPPVSKPPPQQPRRVAPAPERVPAPRPPVIARSSPEASFPPPRTPSAPPAPVTPPSTAPGDLEAYVEARRRARGEATATAPSAPAAAGEDANARANRIAAANLGLTRPPTFGPDPRRTGGIFEVTRLTGDYAEFVFFGWNRDIKRNTAQTIEVRRGAHPDIRIAVIRRMIQIIRDYEQEDFTWESIRLNRIVTLSARPRDTAGLEEFLMREFFENPAGARR